MESEIQSNIRERNTMYSFITFEGGDLCGKTTQWTLAGQYLQQKGLMVVSCHKEHIDKGIFPVYTPNAEFDVLMVREPGSLKISEQIRKILLDNNNTELCAETEALLYAASRGQLVNEVIWPELKRDKIVLSDRYLDSSVAYQGYARNLGMDVVRYFSEFATQRLYPGLTILFDLEIDEFVKRRAGRKDANRLDIESIDFHTKVREAYLMIASDEPKRFRILNGNMQIQDVQQDVMDILLKHLLNSPAKPLNTKNTSSLL